MRPNEKVGSKFKRRRKALEEVSSDSEIDRCAMLLFTSYRSGVYVVIIDGWHHTAL